MPVVTKEELENASLDAKTLEDTINRDVTVVSRLGASYPSIPKLINSLVISGNKQFLSWSELVQSPGTVNGQTGRVTNDTGTHTDPVVGGTVSNTGEYRWSASPAGWQRIGALLDTAGLTAQIDGVNANRAALIKAGIEADPAFVFAGSDGFADLVVNRAGALRSLSDVLDAGTLRIVDDGSSDLLIVSPDGYLLGSFDATGFEGLSDAATQPSSIMPHFSKRLCAVAGEPIDIYLSGLLSSRADAPLSSLTVMGASGRSVTTDEHAQVLPGDLGATAQLITHPRTWSGGERAVLDMSVITAPRPAVAPTTKRVLIAGDSIPNRQGAQLSKGYLEAWGYLPAFIGTVAGSANPASSVDATGPLGECREGWETGDYTYAITDRAIPVAAGDEAAYLAMPKADKVDRNPFIRPATSSDAASIIRNGYVLDFANYCQRFGVETPDVVLYTCGTNDIRDQDGAVVGSTVQANDELILSRMRAAWPNARIIRALPGTSRDPIRDPLWSAEYIPVIRGMMQALVNLNDNRITLAPAWAMAPSDGGYSLIAATPDPVTGAVISTVLDPIHPIGATRAALFRALAMYVACAMAGLI